MRKIAIYGKGGIGKSTTTSNISAALADANYKVMQIGCDPKQDSTIGLVGGIVIPSILDLIRTKGEADVTLDDVCFEGYGGVVVTEAGGPEPGTGCAGKGVITALQLLDKHDAYERYGIDVAIYDVLGDVVCGGFAMPLRNGYAQDVFIVTSGEMMALFAANNIAKSVRRFAENGISVRLGGLICNSRNTHDELELVTAFAKRMRTRVVYKVPRSPEVQIAESRGQTVVEAFQDGAQTIAYRELAQAVLEDFPSDLPLPMENDDLRTLISEYAEDDLRYELLPRPRARN